MSGFSEMAFFSRLRTALYDRAMRRYRTTNINNDHPKSFSDIHTVGILFDANAAEDRDAVLNYVDRLRNSAIEVWPFGFFSTKIEGVTFPFDFIDSTQITFAQLPKGERVKEFIQSTFDVLINLDMELHPPICYTAAASHALFKIGPARGNPNHYDLMVDTHQRNLAKYIEEIRRTFKKISA